MKTVLITGGLGFIGSHFIVYFLHKYPKIKVLNLDKCTYASNFENLSLVENHPNYHFIKGDICDDDLLKSVFNSFDIQGVIHFAAESHVDNSIAFPDVFVKSNIEGTFKLLNVAYNCWMEAPFKVKPHFSQARFHHVSTDEVFGSIENGAFTEDSPYKPSSPYSASKASSDMLVRSYFHTYGLNATMSHCSNNYGKNQHKEKLIPVIVEKALKNEPIPIYGDGKNVRDWLFVEDHCTAIDLIFHQAKSGASYNVGGDNQWDNHSLAVHICNILDRAFPKEDSYVNQIRFVSDRAGHDKRYAINSSKLKKELGWMTERSFLSTLEETVLQIAKRV